MTPPSADTEALVARVHRLDRLITRLQRRLLDALAELERREAWLEDGAHDMTHWTAMQLGVSYWKAGRWVAAGKALTALPATSDAFERGDLGIDKVVELTRFAEFDDEDALVGWAQGVSSGAIRRVADVRVRERAGDAAQAERERHLGWRYTDDGRRFLLDAELPSAQGAVVAHTLERMTPRIPVMPDEGSGLRVGARRADALVALCSATLANDADQDRATVVVHADLDAVLDGDLNAVIDGGPVIGSTTLHRLLCNARVQGIVERPDGSVDRVGTLLREPPPWMLRQLRHRDVACRFPGCGSRRFTQAHHLRWWSEGGRTELDNLILICSFHHKLVHELGWQVERDGTGEVTWIRPSGVRYRAGPAADVA